MESTNSTETTTMLQTTSDTSAKVSSSNETMNSFMCPITHQLFVDPVMASDGFSYERSAIDQWFRSSDKSPVTGMKITRSLVPNHALRNAVQEIYPKQAEEFHKRVAASPSTELSPPSEQPEAAGESNIVQPTVTEFDFSKEEILDMTRRSFGAVPAPGAVYYGIFEQQFQEGDFIAKSSWTIRLEFDTLQDYIQPPVVTASIVWRKHTQSFSSNIESCSPDLRDFAATLNRSVGGSFVSKIRGSFDVNTGKLEMYAYDAETVGNGFYTLLVGQNGETLDGVFYVRNFLDVSQPSTHGRGIFRLKRYQQ